MASQQNVDTVGVVLAGGQSRRMGVADKCLLPFAGAPMLEHVIFRAQPQVDLLLLSANGDPLRFAEFNLPIVPDIFDPHGGPLAGIISAMAHVSKLYPRARWLATFPGDAPLAPSSWVKQLRALPDAVDVALAADLQRTHYTFGLWSMGCLEPLRQQFANGQRALFAVVQTLHSATVVCHEHAASFSNINTPQDLQQLQQR